MVDRADQSLLPGAPPPNAERRPKGVYAIDLSASRLAHVPIEIETLWDPNECPVHLLAWLAWAMNVQTWNAEWSEEVKRQTLRDNRMVHRRRGTRKAVLDVLSAAGYENPDIREGIGQFRYDGTHRFNAVINYESSGHWTYYTIVLSLGDAPPSNALLALIERTAPTRSPLYEIVYE